MYRAGWQAAGLQRTLITMKQLGTELDRMQLFHPLEENFKTLMHRLISLSHADPLFKKFIAFCSRAKIAFSYLPFLICPGFPLSTITFETEWVSGLSRSTKGLFIARKTHSVWDCLIYAKTTFPKVFNGESLVLQIEWFPSISEALVSLS